MTGPQSSSRWAPAGWRRDLRLALARRRRLLAAGLLAGSMACALSVLAPAPPPTAPVVAAAHDLPGGATITDVRLVGPALLAGYGGRLVAAPVRIADAGSARLLQPGDVIDVLAADGASGIGDGTAAGTAGGPVAGEARLVASGVRVVAVPRDDESALTGGDRKSVV